MKDWFIRNGVKPDGRAGPFWEHLTIIGLIPVVAGFWLARLFHSGLPLAFAVVGGVLAARWTYRLDYRVNGPSFEGERVSQRVPTSSKVYAVIFLVVVTIDLYHAYRHGF